MDSGSFGGRFNFCPMSNPKNRVSVYIDGFNLYHAIDDLNYNFRHRTKLGLKPPADRVNHLKWVDLWSLSESFLRPYQELAAVNYFSAYATWKPPELLRHREYVKALEYKGVNVIMGEFKLRRNTCRTCNSSWTIHEEKKSDVTAAVTLVADGLMDKYDDAFLVTADSDLIPAVHRVSLECPKKNIVVVAPPGRMAHSRALNPRFQITAGRLGSNLLPRQGWGEAGAVLFTRPVEYNPLVAPI